MVGIGTLVNVIAILCGGLIGLFFSSRFQERYQSILLKANAIGVIFIGISGALAKMLVINGNRFEVKGTLMMIVSLALGSLLGEWLQIEKRFEQFGIYLRNTTGNAKDKQFVEAFLTATLTVCIGAMAIVGAIEEGLHHNPTILYAKAILDFTIILVMTSTFGKGCLFSAIPVLLLQGGMTLLAQFLAPFFQESVLDAISLVGSILICCVGINLYKEREIKVANMLPSLLIAALWSYFFHV